MRQPSIDALLLTADELQDARQRIREMAYFKWLNAGCPANSALRFWQEAELEWVEYFYVPHRDADLTIPS